jgi:hypothetical protein
MENIAISNIVGTSSHNKYTIHYHVWLRNTFSIYRRKSCVLLFDTNRIGKDPNKLLNLNEISFLMKYKLQINPFTVNREND